MTNSQKAILILPGVPGMEALTVEGRTPYPEGTYDFVKRGCPEFRGTSVAVR